ncbi:hypothetical protein [Acanthopleuribacter pedis]|uniref:Uncharacterized protein n=1 Tax=Acanthopleuribacter pedis TaxID=442870 RepID=A0A8J7QLK9_9BACT|nr:hypothetical protein [Acanthopleuribacter pedis]MBO1320543.1 hypothetical protein [Acanthopleuribacter pedis]
MRYKVPTLSIILAMNCVTCYTPVEAARLGLPSETERSRKRLRSLSINHSFDGYRRRKNESLERYRLRLKNEYGHLSLYIRFQIKFGKNGKRYSAFSGCVFKLAVEPYGLHVAVLAFCHVLLARDYRMPPLYLPDNHGLVSEFSDVNELLRDHVQLYGGGDHDDVNWLNLIPVRTFDAAVSWATGRCCPVMGIEPPEPLRKAFLARLKSQNQALSVGAQAPREKTNVSKRKPCVSLVPTAKTALPGHRTVLLPATKTPLPKRSPKFLPLKNKTPKRSNARLPRKTGILLSFTILALTVGVATFSLLNEPTTITKQKIEAVVLPTSQIIFPDGESMRTVKRKTHFFEPPVVPAVERLTAPAP